MKQIKMKKISKVHMMLYYKTSYPEMINERVWKAVNSGMIEGILPVEIKQGKKHAVIKSEFSHLFSLSTLAMNPVSKEVFFNLVFKLIALIKECEKNNLNTDNLALSMDKVFINPGDMSIQCVYWPIVNFKESVKVSDFFREIPFCFTYKETEKIDYVTKYVEYMNNQEIFSVVRFEDYLKEIYHDNGQGSVSKTEESHYPKEVSAENEKTYNPFVFCKGNTGDTQETELLGSTYYPHLLRKKTGEKIEIYEDSFSIGKSKEQCDYCIENNSAISRQHAIIRFENAEYIVADNNSTNGTFVNNLLIKSGECVILKEGDIIKLGNEEFEFHY